MRVIPTLLDFKPSNVYFYLLKRSFFFFFLLENSCNNVNLTECHIRDNILFFLFVRISITSENIEVLGDFDILCNIFGIRYWPIEVYVFRFLSFRRLLTK